MDLQTDTLGIKIANLGFGYADQVIFRQLDLSLMSGKITAVCGPSGCGKSSLLKLINGLLVPTQGQIYVLGQRLDQSNCMALRRQMGYAVQKLGLFPHLTAEANIRLVAKVEGRTRQQQDERLDFLLERLNLSTTLLQRYPHQLSGGQAQRVSLCRALMLKPKWLLLDEAFAAVDPITRFEIYRTFLKLQKAEGFGVVLVTHDMREAHTLADTLVVMENGQIIRKGNLNEVIEAPNHTLVARLIKEHLLCEA